VEYETVIGLEVHAQLLTNTKIFCGCRSIFGDQPNTRGCPVCLGLPGSLPVLNRAAVEMAIRAGLALGCRIAPRSIFARKNYFYPDLPKGYQISQYDLPLCEDGSLTFPVGDGEKTIGIKRIHLEEDAGKLIHDQDEDSLFDVNRCGTPLAEIVTEPDLRSPQEAYGYLTTLKQILQYLRVCDCNMEEGSLRCDANVSIRPYGQTQLGTKVELKNMNSFRGVERALEYEVRRQRIELESGRAIEQQTYLWDPDNGRTVAMRTKEQAHDYRYFPDPDLIPLTVDDGWIDSLRQTLPELPAVRRQRFIDSHGLSADHATVLTDTPQVADYYEETVGLSAEPKTAANWIMGEILRIVKDSRKDIDTLNVTPARLARVLTLVQEGKISASAAKTVIDEIESGNRESSSVVELHLAKVAVAGSSPVSRSNLRVSFPSGETPFFLLASPFRRHSQVVRQRSAKPLSPVQIWVPPPFFFRCLPVPGVPCGRNCGPGDPDFSLPDIRGATGGDRLL
jgi:aspartyl-tRNA(Asn)/glutamyl-tRNA(Gln) amidotransferase subunit B